MKQMKVLGIEVDDISLIDAVTKITEAVSKTQEYQIVTPNPEIIIQAQTDTKLAQILNQADLSIPDGAGLKLAGIKKTTPGVVLMRELTAVATKRNWEIGLYGGRGNSAQLALNNLQAKHPELKGWAMTAPELKIEDKSKIVYLFEDEYNKIINKVKQNNTKIIFIALGAQKQEYFMDKLKTNAVLMVVGGSFDEIAGLVRPAPNFVTELGLKWLWRLTFQPWRLTRQLRLIKFLFKTMI